MEFITKKTVTFIKSKSQLALLGGILAFIISGSIFLSRGVVLSVDGWAYWEGSVSLLHGNGYKYFGIENASISVFTPLFSILLAIVQFFFGVSGYSLALFISVISGLTTTIYVYLVLSISNFKNTTFFSLLFLIGYFIFFISHHFIILLADTLSVGLFGILLFCATKITSNNLYRYLFLITLTLLLLTKNSNIALLPSCFYIMATSLINTKQKQLMQGFTVVIPVAVWIIVRWFFGQLNSHPLVFHGKYTPVEYIFQLWDGLTKLFFPNPDLIIRYIIPFIKQTFKIDEIPPLLLTFTGFIGGILLIASFVLIYFSITNKKHKKEHLQPLMKIGIIILGNVFFIFILFNTINIFSSLGGGRFLWHVAICIVGILFILYSWEKNIIKRNIILFLIGILAFIPMVVVSVFIFTTIPYGSPLLKVSLNHTISPEYITGPDKPQGSYILRAPPEFEFLNRGVKKKTSSF